MISHGKIGDRVVYISGKASVQGTMFKGVAGGGAGGKIGSGGRMIKRGRVIGMTQNCGPTKPQLNSLAGGAKTLDLTHGTTGRSACGGKVKRPGRGNKSGWVQTLREGVG